MNDTDAAERMYLHSLEILPSRFYTIHLLMTLYDETRQTEKAQEIREMIERRRREAREERRISEPPKSEQIR